jgi:hypothetical protein
MAIEIKWVVTSMPAAPSEDGMTDVVKSISWNRFATETVEGEIPKTYVASFPGVTPCPTPSPENFIPYSELTETHVEGWLNELVDWQSLDEQLTKNIQDQINPPVVVLPLPWAPPTPTPTPNTENE